MMTVLAVDDDPIQLKLLQAILERSGFEVRTASSGADAIHEFEIAGSDIALLVTDVVMPGIDGPTLVARLRAANPELRVLFVSGFLAQYESFVQNGGGQRFLAKPFSAASLVREVKLALAG